MRESGYVISLLALVTCLYSQVGSVSLRQKQTWPARTYPGHLEFPTIRDLNYFGEQLDGDLITPFDSTYLNESRLMNLRIQRLPGLIVKAKTLKDVQRSVLFARKHNLHLSVRSSGHDFIGRSTHDGSLNLNLEKLNEINVKVDSTRNSAGEAKIQTGASWREVYTQVDQVQGPDERGEKMIGRVIVGATSQTVAMGGYTQGGGHSSMGRKFGLVIDNLLEATIVTPDGKVRVVNESATVIRELNGTVHVSGDVSLFWAIRGGGGGTWGVVVDFTFKIHYAPERIRSILAVMPTLDDSGNPINRDDIDFVSKQMSNLTLDWGGYIVAAPGSPNRVPGKGYLLVFLNHQGSNSSSSNQDVDELLSKPSWAYVVEKFDSTFAQYEKSLPDTYSYPSYVFNTFIQGSTIENSTSRSDLLDTIIEMQQDNMYCNGTLIGGQISSVPSDNTPTHPGMRSGLLAMTCGANLLLGNQNQTIENILTYSTKLYKFGNGSFINEPAEDMPDWKMRFWGKEKTYHRLLDIKKNVDPNNYMWCHNCVGSDRGFNYAAPHSIGLIGEPAKSYFHTSVEFDEI